MIIVTGGAGMIGSNIVRKLNAKGINNIIIVDNLKNGKKCKNLSNLDFVDYVDKDDFLNLINFKNFSEDIKVIFHQGACSSTTEWDGKFIMKNNYEYSKQILHWSQNNNIQFINASSASVYGLGLKGFREERECELPINMYAFSKFQFDQYIRKLKNKTSQIVSLRYFNVYGPNEYHKGDMASMVFKFNDQIINEGKCKLFEGNLGYENGEQRRDFIYVEDCVDINIWFMNNPTKSGIYNVGSGQSKTINELAEIVQKWHKNKNKSSNNLIEYIPFPNHLEGSYQNFTEADLNKLRNIGYEKEFINLEEGITSYLNYLNLN